MEKFELEFLMVHIGQGELIITEVILMEHLNRSTPTDLTKKNVLKFILDLIIQLN